MNILVAKKEDLITISFDGKKLIINKNNNLFNELNKLNNKQIKGWYRENHKLLEGGE